jgi:hypothetical protein
MTANNVLQPHEVADFEQLASVEVEPSPFPFLIVPGFVRREARNAVAADFPDVPATGSFPLQGLQFGPAFAALIGALTGSQIANLLAAKFSIDLKDRPVMATVRGRTGAKDGQIHTDSTSKLITLLLYMNDGRSAERGRLRLLRSPNDLDDFAAEAPPDPGTLVVFRNGPTAWHGFETFEGQRRVIQVNWVTSPGVARREQARHRLSAFFKWLGGKGPKHAAPY